MSRRRKAKSKKKISAYELPVLRPHVAGIDLGSREHWVCGPRRSDGNPNVHAFGTTTPQLEQLAQWLLNQEVESVAMESTSVYWIPLYELLESCGIDVLLVNARHLRNVPGRKSDIQDCQWIQLLHSCGLLNGSFRPDEAICRIRALERQCSNLTAERSKAVQWMQKALDQMNVQVHHAVSDLTGKTGMAIVRAIVDGERDPRQLSTYRDKRCKKSEEEIAEHLTGHWRYEHLFNLQMALQLYDTLQTMIESYESQVFVELVALQPPERKSEPVPQHPNPGKEKAIRARGNHEIRTALWRASGVDLFLIDGINSGAAQVVISEVGMNLSSFPSEKNFVSWLKLSPKNSTSAGKLLKKKSKGTGSTRVAGVLRMAALSLRRSKTALGAEFRRTARRKDGAIAVFAVARKLATLIYRMLRYGQHYVDIGEKAYEERFRQKRLAWLKTTAISIGYDLVPAKQNE